MAVGACFGGYFSALSLSLSLCVCPCSFSLCLTRSVPENIPTLTTPRSDLLFGIGLSLLYYTARTGQPYIFPFTADVMTAIVALGASLLVSIIAILMGRFKLHRLHGVVLFVLYAAFLTMSILFAAGVLHVPGLDSMR
jgi:hypothetical protein